MMPAYKRYWLRRNLESIERARKSTAKGLEMVFSPGDLEDIRLFTYQGAIYANAKNIKTGKMMLLVKTGEKFGPISEGRQNDIKKALKL